MILPLAVVDVIAFAGTLLLLSSKGELETLQAYGVPKRLVGKLLAFATCAPLVAFSAAAIPLSSDPGSALLFGAIGLIVTILGGHAKCTTHGHLKMYQGSVGT
jgi:hypothetical protein